MSADATVELGDVSFDPTAGGDFRLSIEGTSNVGKSNTLRVILEDLADVNIPTLIVERLGAITPVRTEDDNIVVVGARDEEGIDLTIPLESLDLIGELVLDRGMKVLVDISTYSDPQDERSRMHLAAAKAVRALNDRAHEKYRTGDRTPALLVIDEAHWLAPKNSAPNPDLDEWVERARGQIIKASTEGGNKGISTIVAYQRRAFLHNGVIQLVRDWISHRPGDEDIDRTAKALRVDSDVLAGLSTGEIVARGPALTDGDLVGPTKVRRCRSPDPREDTFELPDTPPEVSEAIESIQERVSAEQEQRQERQDEIERLEKRVENLEEKREELEQELADQERLTSALENLQSGDNGSADSEVVDQLEEIRDERDALREERDSLQERIDELEEVREERDSLQRRVEELEAELDEREAPEELEELRDGLADLVRRHSGTLDVDSDDRVEELEAELQQLREQRDALEGQTHQEFDGVDELLAHETVQERVDEVAAGSDYADEHTWDAVTALASVEWTTPEGVEPYMGVAESSTGDVLRGLADAGLVEKRSEGNRVQYRLDRDAVQNLVENYRKRERLKSKREDLSRGDA